MTTHTKRMTMGVILAAAFAAITIAAGVRDGHAKVELADRFEPLAPLVGYEWHIKDNWSDGTTLEAKTSYRVGLNGQFVEASTFARDDGSDWYHRYENIYVIDPNTGDLKSYGITFDGTAAVVDFEVKTSEDGNTLLEIVSDTPNGKLRQTVEIRGEDYLWNVWMQPVGMDNWMTLMDGGVWKRGKKLDH